MWPEITSHKIDDDIINDFQAWYWMVWFDIILNKWYGLERNANIINGFEIYTTGIKVHIIIPAVAFVECMITTLTHSGIIICTVLRVTDPC